MKRFTFFLALFVLLALGAQEALVADSPPTFSVQGVLRNPLGRTVDDGEYALWFRLWDAAEGGNEVWMEAHGSVQVKHGMFVAVLGTLNNGPKPLADVSFLNTYWLGITVADPNSNELTPRIKLSPTPYSLSVLGVSNRFPSTGNVGIGTTSPTHNLTVNGVMRLSDAGKDMYMGQNKIWVGGSGDQHLTLQTTGNGNVIIRTPTGNAYSKVGINTPSPGYTLDMAGTMGRKLAVYNANGNFYGFGIAAATMQFYAHAQANDTPAMILRDYSGEKRVGIGTEDPTQKLTVNGNIKLNTGGIIFADNSTLTSSSLGGSASGVSSDNTDVFISTGRNIQMQTAGATRMYVANNGNVGIGTTSPAQKLTVKGLVKIEGDAGDILYAKDNHIWVDGLTANEDLTLQSKGTGVVKIQGNAHLVNRVGIGTGGPKYLLDMGSSLDSRKLAVYSNGDYFYGFGIQGGVLQFYADAQSGENPDMVIQNTGNVGIGTTLPPSHKLTVNGVTSIDNIQIGQNKIWLGAVSGQPGQDLTLQPQGDGNVIISPGNVGIGTTNPHHLLDLGSGDGKKLAVLQTSAGTAFYGLGVNDAALGLYASANTSDVPDMVVKNTGNVGIGTTSPKAKLDIEDGAEDRSGTHNQSPKGLYVTGDFGYADGVEFRHTNGGQGIGFGYNTIYAAGSDANQHLKFKPKGTGGVGIGLDIPLAPLHVHGSYNKEFSIYAYLQNVQNDHVGRSLTNTTFGISILASNAVEATHFIARSDERIKKIIGTSSSQNDLKTLEQLQVTDYTYVDSLSKSNRRHKKLIAQQVQEVFPNAVSASTDFIPDVYELSETTTHDAGRGELTVTTAKEHGFAVGDTMRVLLDEGGWQEMPILAVADARTFTVPADAPADKVFVFGKKVHDFLSIDYEAIGMLNVSATQELARQVESLRAENATLQEKIRKVTAENATLETLRAENAALKGRMTRFEAALRRLEAMTVQGKQEEGELITSAAVGH